jgi:hypothetical protein
MAWSRFEHLRQTGFGAQPQDLVNLRLAQIAVHQQDAATEAHRGHDRQVDRGRGLAFAGKGTRHRERANGPLCRDRVDPPP